MVELSIRLCAISKRSNGSGSWGVERAHRDSRSYVTGSSTTCCRRPQDIVGQGLEELIGDLERALQLAGLAARARLLDRRQAHRRLAAA
jgi:hypothetical protein